MVHPSRGGRLALAALSVTALAIPASATAASAEPSLLSVPLASDMTLVDGNYKDGRPLPLTSQAEAGAARTTLSAPQTRSGGGVRVGDEKDWPSLIDGGVKQQADNGNGGKLRCKCKSQPVEVTLDSNVAFNHACKFN